MSQGTRGDLEPFLALARGLMARGHSVNLATGREYAPLVAEQGVEHSPINLDFLAVMKSPDGLASKNGDKQAARRLRREFYDPAIVQIMRDLWEAARGTQLIVSNHAVYYSRHIADKLGVPFVLSTCSPFLTPTRAFPFMFLTNRPLGGLLNWLSYLAIHLILPWQDHPWVVRACREVLGTHPGSRFSSILERRGRPIPVLYHFSPTLSAAPSDWPRSTRITGYWHLERAGYQPPEKLEAFLAAGPPPVYLGFGSMVTSRGPELGELVARALELSGQRAVLCAGEGGLADPGRPETVYYTDFVPFDWLFPRVSAVVHHGGTGVTTLGLKHGRPTVICPVIGDQEYWARRLHALGAAPPPFAPRYRDLTAESLARALRQAVEDPSLRRRAEELGRGVAREDGVTRAVEAIEEVARG